MKRILILIAFAAIVTVARAEAERIRSVRIVAETTATCMSKSYEYCQWGCENLGGWVVQPFDSRVDAELYLSSLTSLEQTSAQIVQPPSAWTAVLLLRREDVTDQAPRPNTAEPHFFLEVYSYIQDATRAYKNDSRSVGIYSGNDGQHIVVKHDPCFD